MNIENRLIHTFVAILLSCAMFSQVLVSTFGLLTEWKYEMVSLELVNDLEKLADQNDEREEIVVLSTPIRQRILPLALIRVFPVSAEIFHDKLDIDIHIPPPDFVSSYKLS